MLIMLFIGKKRYFVMTLNYEKHRIGLKSRLLDCIKQLRERGYNDEMLANALAVVFHGTETDITRSLVRTIEYQQYVINELVNVENKDNFIRYIQYCIEQGSQPHGLDITNWDEFFSDLELGKR